MPSSRVNFGWIDYSLEPSHTALHVEEVTAANFDDIFDATTGTIDLLRLALEDVTKLNETRVLVSIEAHSATPTAPANATAQREIAARMTYIDTVTNKKYRFDIPAPADAYVPTGTDEISMSMVSWAAFKVIFDANAVSEFGNAVALLSGRIVGRRN